MHALTLAEVPDEVLDNIVPMSIFVVGGLVAGVAIIAGTIKCIVNSRGRERTRREIAAYVAEGSMTPAEGERLLKASPNDKP